MTKHTPETVIQTPSRSAEPAASAAWSAPRFEVISLDCEITAYAPEGDQPLF